ncbi:MAG: hypothetical protein ACI4LA_04215 [Emergencia sp.]
MKKNIITKIAGIVIVIAAVLLMDMRDGEMIWILDGGIILLILLLWAWFQSTKRIYRKRKAINETYKE